MVSYIRSDLDFILAQIKIAEDHALCEQRAAQGVAVRAGGSDPDLQPVAGACARSTAPTTTCCPARTSGALPTTSSRSCWNPDSGPSWSIPMAPARRHDAVPVTYTPGVDNDGPGTSPAPSDVFDPTVRTISNLLVDQTLGNPSAILTALQRAGIVDPAADGRHRADLGAL